MSSHTYPVEALPRRLSSTAVASPSRSLQDHEVNHQPYAFFVLHDVAISQHIFIISRAHKKSAASCCEDPKCIMAAPLQKGQALQVVNVPPTRPARLVKV